MTSPECRDLHEVDGAAFVCRQPRGHKGPHVSSDPFGRPTWRWPA